jgi:hypothetical protein
MDFKQGIVNIESTGAWQEKNLIVCLGSDPASTLLAIYTHRPSQLIILVDQNTPLVCVVAERIRSKISDLHAQKIHFWPTDLTGNILYKDKLIQQLEENEWIANITPGTKAQS